MEGWNLQALTAGFRAPNAYDNLHKAQALARGSNDSDLRLVYEPYLSRQFGWGFGPPRGQ